MKRIQEMIRMNLPALTCASDLLNGQKLRVVDPQEKINLRFVICYRSAVCERIFHHRDRCAVEDASWVLRWWKSGKFPSHFGVRQEPDSVASCEVSDKGQKRKLSAKGSV